MNNSSIPSIPSISAASVPTDVKRAFDALRSFFDGLQKEGIMTTADLIASGILNKDGSKPVNPQDVAAGTVPPAPENLTANGAFRTIILDWTNPPYKYFSHVEVWRSETDDINAALLVGTTTGSLYSDAPPVALTSKTYYYWVRIVSTANVAGPWNATSGTVGHTADDPGYVLELLNQRIQAGQLHSSLGTRIDKIEGHDSAIINLQNTASELVSSINTLQINYNTMLGSIQTQQSITSVTTGPVWSAGTQYYKGKVVQYANALYQATAAAPTVGIAPSSNLSQWKSVTNSLYGEYTVKIDNNGYVAGFGLANDGVTSQFLVRADVFAVGAPGVSGSYPFVVDTGTNQVVMDNALIKNLTSTNIKAGTINADLLNAANIRAAGWLKAGQLEVGEQIRSGNFINGVSGWAIDYLGNAQFNNVYARGNIEADRLKANVAMVKGTNIYDHAIDSRHIAENAVSSQGSTGDVTFNHVAWKTSETTYYVVARLAVDFSTNAYKPLVIYMSSRANQTPRELATVHGVIRLVANPNFYELNSSGGQALLGHPGNISVELALTSFTHDVDWATSLYLTYSRMGWSSFYLYVVVNATTGASATGYNITSSISLIGLKK